MSNREKEAFIDGIEFAIDYGMSISNDDYKLYCLLSNTGKGE